MNAPPDQSQWSLQSRSPAQAQPQAQQQPPPGGEPSEELPLTAAQSALWYLDRLHGPSATYNVGVAMLLRGPLDFDALRRGFQSLTDAHAALRVRFGERDGVPFQTIAATVACEIDVIAMTGVDDPDGDATLAGEIRRFNEAAFDLGSSPPMRVRLYRLGPQSHVLQYTLHHIVADGWALGVIARDLSRLYACHSSAGFDDGRPPIERQDPYPQMLRELRRQPAPAPVADAVGWWRESLAGLEPLQLPSDRGRSAHINDLGAKQQVQIDADLTGRLGLLARQSRVTLFAVLLCAFKVLIHRVSDSRDFAVGIAMSGRDHEGLEDMVGHFVNVLPLRTRPDPSAVFDAYLRQVWNAVLDVFDNRHVSFDRLVAELEPERIGNRNPLFQVCFVLQNAPSARLDLNGLSVSELQVGSTGSRFDLTLSLTETDGSLGGYFEYRRDLFDESSVRTLALQFLQVLRTIAEEPGRALRRVDLMTPEQYDRVLRLGLGAHWRVGSDGRLERACMSEAPDASVTSPTLRTGTSAADLVLLFERRVRERPDAIAVDAADQSLSYLQLNARANRLAHWLAAQAPVPRKVVAVCLSRGGAWVSSLLGVLKAGLAYVPLDPDLPPARLGAMLADCRADLVLTEPALLDKVSEAVVCSANGDAGTAGDGRQRRVGDHSESARVVPIGTVLDDGQWPSGNPAPPVDAGRLAYVMYTSGTTGTPKGVCIEARSIVALVCGSDYVRFEPGDRVAQASNVAFDAATFEVWGALLNGARLEVIESSALLSTPALAAAIRARRISIMFLTTSLFNGHANTDPTLFAPLRTLVIGGEACDTHAVAAVLRHGAPARLLNGYGPTETTTFACWHEFTPACVGLGADADAAYSGSRSPIGRPLAGARCHVLRADGSLAPIGVIGEIHIGGTGLARGYLNDAVLSAERFIDDPLFPGERLYRSGDLGRLKADGVLEYVGRKDRQLKLRGFRIELAEVERALLKLSGVRQAVVLLRESDQRDRFLDAYLVADWADDRAQPDRIAELRRQLATSLPHYAMPATITALDRLPLTANGKLDSALLHARRKTSQTSPAAAPTPADGPQAAMQQRLLPVWRAVLGRQDVGVDDHFIDAGGHSLLGLKLLAAIARATGRQLGPSALLTAPTVRAQAELLAAQPDPAEPIHGAGLLVPVRAAGALPPLILVRGFGDLSLDYRALLARLPESQPLYVLDLAAAGALVHETDSLQALARLLASRIRGVLPEGPLHVCGHSMAGNLAWELAFALHESMPRESAGRVVLLDCYAPGYPSLPPRALRWLIRSRAALRAGPGQLLRFYRERFRRGFRDLLPLLPRALDRIVIAPAARDQHELERGWVSLYRLWQAHAPSSYAGPVTMIRASIRDGEFASRDDDPAAGWSRYARAPIDVLPIECGHVQIIHAAQASDLGGLLRRCLS